MPTKRKLTAREAMAIAEVSARSRCDLRFMRERWSHPAVDREGWRQLTDRILRRLRRLGFSILPTPPRRGRGKR